MTSRILTAVACCLTWTAGGCSPTFVNQTASLGGASAGLRGTVQLVVINNTPHRAVTTYGTFDPADQLTRPNFEQLEPGDFDRTLNGGSQTTIRELTCGRVFSIGSEALNEAIGLNVTADEFNAEAVLEGVEFLTLDGEDMASGSAGFAPPFEALLGLDFTCGSLLVVRLEFDDAGPDPFRIDFEVIPSSSTR